MAFKISLVQGQPVWDSLPVAKIIDYPLEPRDYKPYAQTRLCISEDSIWVRMWAFEATPSASSSLTVALNPYPELGGKYFTLTAAYDGTQHCSVWDGTRQTPMEEYFILPQIKAFSAEDLQGIYWGVVFRLPRTLLEKVYGSNVLTPKLMRGNLFKTDVDLCSTHYGCFYRADFTAKNPYGPTYFGDFELVAY